MLILSLSAAKLRRSGESHAAAAWFGWNSVKKLGVVLVRAPIRKIRSMKLFSCQGCGQLLYFENVLCENVASGFSAIYLIWTEISALDHRCRARPGEGAGRAEKGLHNSANNVKQFGVWYNWIEPHPADDAAGFCATACRHNHVIPDLTVPGKATCCGVSGWRSPSTGCSIPCCGCICRWKTAPTIPSMAWRSISSPIRRKAMPQGVMTGPWTTVSSPWRLKEADDATREKVRGEMGEAPIAPC